MPVIISKENLKDISQTLQTGMRCWYHIPTGQVLSAPDRSQNFDVDEEIWADTYNEIDAKLHECILFEKMDSREEFKIMESFAEHEVDDTAVSNRLIYSLNQRKPFMQFKAAINYETKYLKQWYAYKDQCYLEHVEEILDWHNSKKEDETSEE